MLYGLYFGFAQESLQVVCDVRLLKAFRRRRSSHRRKRTKMALERCHVPEVNVADATGDAAHARSLSGGSAGPEKGFPSFIEAGLALTQSVFHAGFGTPKWIQRRTRHENVTPITLEDRARPNDQTRTREGDDAPEVGEAHRTYTNELGFHSNPYSRTA